MDALSQLAELILENAEFVVPVIAIFSRVSLFVFMLPGLGEVNIPVRVRLSVAFLLTWMLVPMIAPTIDAQSLTLANSTLLILKESFYGFLLGFAFRVMVFGLQITGSIISQSMSLSQIFGEGITTEPNTTMSTLFMLAGITLAITMDLHIMAIGVFVGSFETFPLGTSPAGDETAYWVAQRFAGVFSFSLALALPFMILNFVYNLILGFLNRAMPQLMVSFVGMPAITGAGIFLLVLSAGSILMLWMSEYNSAFSEFPGIIP
ncbi:MAG: type III secretion protein [Acidimicrobiales bacterium]|nr:flagellar biosynthetic protein FliR [Hyphomonadaceae bacterium]RZV39177.1 MAG: type III secretion protein [Acidimicrobiales bacterium]